MARILVVDDDPVVAALLFETLTTAGHQVILANDVALGFALTQSQSLDLAIVDIEMPGEQVEKPDALPAGFELLQRIKEHNASIAVIIITGAASQEWVVATLRGGGQDFLQKPFISDDVLKRVVAALEQQKIAWAD